MRVCVTGGTGFLGRHIVMALLHAGHEVRVLSRRGWPERDDRIDDMWGSVLDANTCAKAVEGMDAVLHLAGRVSRDPDDSGELMRLHVEGTRALMTAAKEAGTKRIVYMSTSGTIGVSKDIERIATEDDDYPIDLVRSWPYYLSKIYAEQEALTWFKRDGLPIIILNPTLLLGPGDDDGSSTGDVERFLKGQLPVIPKGGMSFVDVRDVAHAAVNALSQGTLGERYLLGSCNLTTREFFHDLARMSGRPAPLLQAPERVSSWSSRLLSGLHEFGVGHMLPINHIDVEMGSHGWFISSDKAQEGIGFTPRDPHDTLFDTIEDVKERLEID